MHRLCALRYVYLCVVVHSYPTLCDPMEVACQASLSVGFSRQEYWSGLPFPTPRGLPNPEIKPTSVVSPALAGGFFTPSTTWDPDLVFCDVRKSMLFRTESCQRGKPLSHSLISGHTGRVPSPLRRHCWRAPGKSCGFELCSRRGRAVIEPVTVFHFLPLSPVWQNVSRQELGEVAGEELDLLAEGVK